MTDAKAVHPGHHRRIQVRREDPRAFGEERRQTFLDHLAGCCNVTHAAAAVGVSVKTVSNHRRKDPAFAAQCEQALDTGYFTLEASLIERAARAQYTPGPDAETVPGPEAIDTTLAVQLLALRGKRRPTGRTGGPPPGRVTETELNRAIIAKMDLLAERTRAGRPLGFRGRKGTRA